MAQRLHIRIKATLKIKARLLDADVSFGSITPDLRCLLYRPLSTIPDIFTSVWDDSAAAILRLNSKRPAQPRRLRVPAVIPWAREPSPTNLHIDCTKPGLNDALSNFSWSQFVGEWRTIDEAREADRFMAG
jgi:hypothetical protein